MYKSQFNDKICSHHHFKVINTEGLTKEKGDNLTSLS
jgi:hypothetical protein